jgi:hypothetical protein
MLGWFKRRQTPQTKATTDHEDGPAIAALLLEGDSFPLAGLQQQVMKGPICGSKPTDVEVTKGFLTCSLGDEIVAWAPMPAPYPWSDLEGPCATSWMWPTGMDASKVIRPHRTHVLVTMVGGKADRIRRRLLLTALTAMGGQQPGVLGIYWPEGTMVHYPKVFVEMANEIDSPKAPPLYLWVDFRVFRNQDGTCGMFTTGLSSIGFMEFEIPSVAMEPGELRQWAVNISYYLIEKGPVLKDGDTIGATKDEMFRIRHMPSRHGKKEKVMQFAVE